MNLWSPCPSALRAWQKLEPEGLELGQTQRRLPTSVCVCVSVVRRWCFVSFQGPTRLTPLLPWLVVVAGGWSDVERCLLTRIAACMHGKLAVCVRSWDRDRS